MEDVEDYSDSMDLFSAIRSAKESFGDQQELWFRGHISDDYELKPSLMRFDNGLEKERDLFWKFKQLSKYIHDGNAENWEAVVDMQHYGLPTRLLDWSSVVGIALFFATINYDSDSSNQSPTLYLLDPKALNLKSNITEIRRIDENAENFSFEKMFITREIHSPTCPVAIDPLHRNKRIMAQKGTFTVHNHSAMPLEQQAPEVLRRIVLSEENVAQAKEFLDNANVNEFTIFPDFVGASTHIQRLVGLK